MGTYLRMVSVDDELQVFLFGKIVCADGFEMSVQASSHHYCVPRTDRGAYSNVEVGYPNQPEILLAPYSEIKGRYDEEDNWVLYTTEELERDTVNQVFPYTPIKVVLDIIKKHGGRAPCCLAEHLRR